MRLEQLRAIAAGVALSALVGVAVAAVVLGLTYGVYELLWAG